MAIESREGNTLVIRAELPDLDPDTDIEVYIAHDVLHIRGVRETGRAPADPHSDLRYGSFVRDIGLPTGTGEDAVSASYGEGVLEVRAPIGTGAKVQSRTVPIDRTPSSPHRQGTPTSTQDIGAETSRRQLTGVWVSGLGSRLVIDDSRSGELLGTYETAVGELAGTEHRLVGYCDEGADGGEVPLGFVVRWDEDDSVTTWCGCYDPTSDEISTTWLLASAVMGHVRAWKSALVGQDTFRRVGNSS